MASIVLLHNGFDSSKTWDRILPLLPDDFRVVAYDRKGYGSRFEKGYVPGPDLIAEGTAELDGLVSALVDPEEDLFLWGHCIGGAIALSWAAQNRRAVSGILGEAVGFFSTRQIVTKAELLLADFAQVPERYQNHLKSMHGKNTEALWEQIRGYRESYIMNPEYSILDACGRVDAPVLLLQGDRDVYFDFEHARRGAEALPNAQVRELPGGTHDLHRQSPREIGGIAYRFFSGAESPA